MNPTSFAVDIPGVAADMLYHDVSLSVLNDAGIPGTTANNVTSVTMNSSAVNRGSDRPTVHLDLAGIVVGPVAGGMVAPQEIDMFVMVDGIKVTDVTATQQVGYDPTTARDTVSWTGSADIAAVQGTHSVGIVYVRRKGNEATPEVPFLNLTIDTISPTIGSVGPIAAILTAPIDAVSVTFSKPIMASSFDQSNLSLTRDGIQVVLGPLTITPQDAGSSASTRFVITGLAPYTTNLGDYVLSVSPIEIIPPGYVTPPGFVPKTVIDPVGNRGAGPASINSFSMKAMPPVPAGAVVTLIQTARVREHEVVAITFNRPMNLSSAGNRANYSLFLTHLGRRIDRGVHPTSATYDPIYQRVLLSFEGTPRNDGRYLIRINGATPAGLTDTLTGNALEGQIASGSRGATYSYESFRARNPGASVRFARSAAGKL